MKDYAVILDWGDEEPLYLHIVAPDDREALEMVQRPASDAQSIELWQGTRLAARIERPALELKGTPRPLSR